MKADFKSENCISAVFEENVVTADRVISILGKMYK